MTLSHSIAIDPKTGGLTLKSAQRHVVLHPIWVRERVRDVGVFDSVSHQRLYEHVDLYLKHLIIKK